MRRVVISGIGILSPLGAGIDHVWNRLINGDSGISKITRFDTQDLTCKIAGTIPEGQYTDNKFNPNEWVEPKEQRRIDNVIVYAITAAQMAFSDCGWKPQSEEECERTGVLVGSGIGGLQGIENGAITLEKSGARRISPFFIPSSLINMASGHISMMYQCKGPNHSVVTACATGTHAIGDAARMIMLGDADTMVAGGSEAAVCRLGIAGFAAARALSTNYNDTPEQASRPWDKGRDGFVMGEGAGIVILEEYEKAKKRNARIYAEVCGYGMSGDAHHITAPPQDGNGGFRAMQAALKNANINKEQIDYINAHGTSTPLGDEIELGAVKRLFQEHAYKLSMSSTKSSIGHLLGAAGAVEAIFTAKAIHHNILPPTLNLNNPEDNCDLDLVALKAKEKNIKYALSNSFGFGGTNASLIFKKI